MEIKTLTNVKNLLKASNYSFLDGDTAFQMFAEDVKRYADDEVINGAKQFVRDPGKYPNYPGLLEAIRNEHYAREDYSYRPEDWNNAVKCPKCNDRGYIFHYWKKDIGEGRFLYTETMAACNCSTGRARFPSLLQTQKERDAWTFEAARKGGSPLKKLFDYTETEFREAVGEEISESQYNREFAFVVRKKQAEMKEAADLWKELADAFGK